MDFLNANWSAIKIDISFVNNTTNLDPQSQTIIRLMVDARLPEGTGPEATSARA